MPDHCHPSQPFIRASLPFHLNHRSIPYLYLYLSLFISLLLSISVSISTSLHLVAILLSPPFLPYLKLLLLHLILSFKLSPCLSSYPPSPATTYDTSICMHERSITRILPYLMRWILDVVFYTVVPYSTVLYRIATVEFSMSQELKTDLGSRSLRKQAPKGRQPL